MKNEKYLRILCPLVAICVITYSGTFADTAIGFFDNDGQKDCVSFQQANNNGLYAFSIILNHPNTPPDTISTNYQSSNTFIEITNPDTGLISIFEYGNTAHVEQTTSVFMFNNSPKSWVLFSITSREFTGKPTQFSVTYFVPSKTVLLDGTSPAGLKNSQSNISRYKKLQDNLININLSKLEVQYKNNTIENSDISINHIQLCQMIHAVPIDTNSVERYNNIGYYCTKSKFSLPAGIYLLEQIIKSVPSRTVAYLNLADAYLNLNDVVRAKKHYQTYIDQMKANGKVAKIPKRVFDSLNE